MTTPTRPTVPSRSRLRNWFLMLLAAAMVVAVVEAAGIFFLAKGARDLKVAINAGLGGEAQTKIQFSVGPGLLGVGHFASRWIDDMPDEARQVLGALRGASVGIYELAVSPSGDQRLAMMRQTDERLFAQGWTRIVGVNEPNRTVMIYLPAAVSATDTIKVCVAVCDGPELVVVSAEASSKAILALAGSPGGELRKRLRTPKRDRA